MTTLAPWFPIAVRRICFLLQVSSYAHWASTRRVRRGQRLADREAHGRLTSIGGFGRIAPPGPPRRRGEPVMRWGGNAADVDAQELLRGVSPPQAGIGRP